ncbi:hypothetical protein PANT_10d00041 [Moesziomyces antarcticus T-34]|nr:hypothetical protein PANT_10d00041 [Moesziomyces antarcticus T-34]
MLTGELKQKCIAVLQKVVSNFQQKKAAVSDELVREFMNKNRSIDPTMPPAGSTAKNQAELAKDTTVATA